MHQPLQLLFLYSSHHRATHNLYMLVNKYLGKRIEKGDTGVSTLDQLDKVCTVLLPFGQIS
jgi:hypothetical protein